MNNFTFDGPQPFKLVCVLHLQFRAEMLPTLSSDYLIMHCQLHFYDEMTRTCKKTDCRTETERKIVFGAENNKFQIYNTSKILI